MKKVIKLKDFNKYLWYNNSNKTNERYNYYYMETKMKKYGYCRISTSRQNIERQVRNILTAYPDAAIRKEVFTGTKFQGRRELERILENVQEGDMIIFDSVSRMSRNAEFV